jgi:hypothetical protein
MRPEDLLLYDRIHSLVRLALFVMSPSREVPEHPDASRRRRLRYVFHPKHHVGGLRSVAQWSPNISRNEEFGIFDTADRLEIVDERGNLYGALLSVDGEVRTIGTWDEQVAFFPIAGASEPWHGYPLFPVNAALSKRKPPPKRDVPLAMLRRMSATGLLSIDDSNRLARGRHA